MHRITKLFGEINYFSDNHLKSELKQRAVKSASITVAGQIIFFVIQTLGTIIIARQLSPNDFGLVAMTLSVSLLLQSLGCNGFVEAVVQAKEIHHKQISTLFWINAVLGLTLMLLFIFLAPIIAWFYNEPKLKSIVVVLSISIFFGGLSNQHISLVSRNMQFLKITLNEIIAACTSISIAILLANLGWSYWALVAKWIISPFMITLGAWLMCSWRPSLPARATGVKPLLVFAFNTYGNFIMSYFRKNFDKLLIGRFYGSQPLGNYDRAYHLSNMLPNQLLNPLNSVSVSTFSRLTDEPEKYRIIFLAVISILAFVGMPLSASLTLISRDVILLLLGPKWEEAGVIFSAFGPSIGLIIIYMTSGWLHLSLGTPNRWFRWSFLEFFVTVFCFIVGIQFGVLGVAIAYSVSFYILFAPTLWYAGRPINLKISSILLAIWKYYISAFSAGLICWLLLYKYGVSSLFFINLNILIRISISVILCVSVYMFLIIILFKDSNILSQLFSLLRMIVKK